MLIEQAKEVNEAPEGPTAVILLFFLAFGCRITWRLTATRCASFAAQFLTLAKHQGAMVPLMMGHHVMAISLAATGDLTAGLAHFDRATALYQKASSTGNAFWRGCEGSEFVLSFMGRVDARVSQSRTCRC